MQRRWILRLLITRHSFSQSVSPSCGHARWTGTQKGEKEKRQRHIQEKMFQKAKKICDHFAKESLWSTQCYCREESRTCTEDMYRQALLQECCFWSHLGQEAEPIAGMACDYNTLRDKQCVGGRKDRPSTGRIWAKVVLKKGNKSLPLHSPPSKLQNQ